MKDILYRLLMLVGAVAGFAACSGSDDAVAETSSDCYISAFALGQMKRVIHVTSSTGTDSTYTISFSGSLYPMSINQLQGTVSNAEPLPADTRLDAVLLTISAQGTVVYTPSPVSDASEWTVYSSTDSIDISVPQVFRVYANNASGDYRQYTLRVNVRQDAAQTFLWDRQADIAAIVGRREIKLLNFRGNPVFLSADVDGRLHASFPQAGTDSMGEEILLWDDQPCRGADGAVVRLAGVFDGRLWTSTADGRLLTSEDAVEWTEVPQGTGVTLDLMAASPTALYAHIAAPLINTPGYIGTSTDGRQWSFVGMEQEYRFAGTAAAVAYTQDNGNPRVLVAGQPLAEADTTLCVWSLLERSGESWTLFGGDDVINHYRLPAQAAQSMVSYNGWLIAVGAGSLLFSYDNGITWKTDSYLEIPETLAADAPTTAAAFGQTLWLVAGSQLWHIRYTDYGK